MIVTADHPYYGAVTINARSADEAIALALVYDHGVNGELCDDYAGCDIARSLRDGYPYTAAHRMVGATECPTLDAVIEAWGIDLYAANGWPTDHDAWCEHIHAFSFRCDACNGITYADEDNDRPERCASCHAHDVYRVTD